MECSKARAIETCFSITLNKKSFNYNCRINIELDEDTSTLLDSDR